ncbi:MAG: hypothetical protein WCR95_02315 [Eubacteriales bacterium]
MKTFKKTLCLLCVIALILPFSACSKKSEAIMSFRGSELSTNMFSYMLAAPEVYMLLFTNTYLPYVYQTTYAAYGIGYSDFQQYVQSSEEMYRQLFNDFYSSFGTAVKDADGNQTTLAVEYFDSILPYLKRTFVISALCEDYGLTLTDKNVKSQITAEIDGYIDAAGNKDFLEIYLFDKYGATLDIAREYAQKYSLYYTMNSEYGFDETGGQTYWNSGFVYLNNLLYLHLYGENGIKRPPESEVKTRYLTDFRIVDEIFYNAYKTENSVSKLRLEDFISEDITSYFNENYVKLTYVLLNVKGLSEENASQIFATAEEILSKIQSGELEIDDDEKIKDLYSGAKTGMFCFEPGDGSVEEAVEDALSNLKDGEFGVVSAADSIYVIRRDSKTEEDLAAVKDGIISTLARSYFDENYNKANYIFLSYYDIYGEKLAQEKIDEIDSLGEEIAQKLKNGEISFDNVEDEYKTSVYSVSAASAVFGPGEITDELNDVMSTLQKGDFSTAVGEDGFYVLGRIEKEDADFSDSVVRLGMTMAFLRELANDFLGKYNSGEIDFDKAPENDDYAEYMVLDNIDFSKYAAEIESYFGIKDIGEAKLLEQSSGIYIIHLTEVTESDFEKYKDKIMAQNFYESFCDYIESLYDEITIDNDELERYREAFANNSPLTIPSYDKYVSES